jgi:plasmid maintenance system killer protein
MLIGDSNLLVTNKPKRCSAIGLLHEFQGFGRPAKRKLEMLDAASRLDDLLVPPSNRLEKLKGDLAAYHSVRINDQWRSSSPGRMTMPLTFGS